MKRCLRCARKVRARGLCDVHYSESKSRVDNGRTTWDELENKGLAQPLLLAERSKTSPFPDELTNLSMTSFVNPQAMAEIFRLMGETKMAIDIESRSFAADVMFAVTIDAQTKPYRVTEII